MGDRQRFQSQYERDRGRQDHRDDNRAQRLQPREWQPGEDHRRDEQRDPRDHYANYYNDRQFGTRGRDEREQGTRYGGEEEWRPWPNDSGYASREYGYGRDERQRRAQSQSQYGDHERSYGSSYSPRSFDDNAAHVVESYGSYAPSDYRGRAERQPQQRQREWSGSRYPADNDYYANQPREEHHESFGHQLREAGQKIARSVKRAFRGPKGYKRSDDRIREDVSDRLGEIPTSIAAMSK